MKLQKLSQKQGNFVSGWKLEIGDAQYINYMNNGVLR